MKRPVRVLYIETYPAGSHGRILDLLTSCSRHSIAEVRLDRAHWKWLAIAAHHEVVDRISANEHHPPPDVIVLSGPLNVAALVSLMPPAYRHVPRVVYMHESQWTYPSLDADPRPYVVQHLDALRASDEVWFNSRFHLETFWSTATSTAVDHRVQALAKRLRPLLEPRCRVVYPPVKLDTRVQNQKPSGDAQRLLWNARWELDKRPEVFVALLDRLAKRGIEPQVLILGTGGRDTDEIRAALDSHADRALIPGHLSGRADYERLLASADVVVSTAAHEFFGVAMLEAALAGATPVLPRELAYPETLPSAYFYQPCDVDDLARVTGALLSSHPRQFAAHRTDAARFDPALIVPVWDEQLERMAKRSSR